MTSFWISAALLCVLAFGFIWWPIWMHRRQQRPTVSSQQLNVEVYRSRLGELDLDRRSGRIGEQEYQALETELERNLLSDLPAEADDVGILSTDNKGPSWLISALLSLLLVVSAILLYMDLGSSKTLARMEQQHSLAEQMEQLAPEERLKLLEREAESDPANVELWYALAQGYLHSQRVADAERAYDHILTVVGEQPDILAEYAQALFLVQGNRVTEKIKGLVDRTLAVQPSNTTALGLLGIDAFENKRYADAIKYWQQILDSGPEGQGAEALMAGIERAKSLMAESDAEEGDSQATAVNPEITVEVALSSALQSQAAPQQSVFVFARALEGPPLPLAAVKLKVEDLPAQVVLNDSMAMTPMARLSQFEQVEVVARISQSASPTAQSGDLQGTVSPINVKPSQTSIKILIDNVVE